jgi:competence protein ComEC
MDRRIAELAENAKLFSREYGKIFTITISLAVSLMSLYAVALSSSPHMLRISFLDVGQGDAILVRTPSGHDMLIDGGPSDAVLARMNEEMSYFDRDLDVVIATHDDADHVTGLIPVFEKYDVRTIIVSPATSQTNIARDLHSRMDDETDDRRIGQRGDAIDFGDGVVARILFPNGTVSAKAETNDASVNVVITYGEHSFLFTGDLSSKHERQLFGNTLPRGVTVYKAGHHGSKTSSGEELLSYVKPEYAVISAGKDNRYGHPNPEALERLHKYAKETISTIDRGTITFTSNGRILDMETEK